MCLQGIRRVFTECSTFTSTVCTASMALQDLSVQDQKSQASIFIRYGEDELQWRFTLAHFTPAKQARKHLTKPGFSTPQQAWVATETKCCNTIFRYKSWTTAKSTSMRKRRSSSKQRKKELQRCSRWMKHFSHATYE